MTAGHADELRVLGFNLPSQLLTAFSPSMAPPSQEHDPQSTLHAPPGFIQGSPEGSLCLNRYTLCGLFGALEAT